MQVADAGDARPGGEHRQHGNAIELEIVWLAVVEPCDRDVVAATAERTREQRVLHGLTTDPVCVVRLGEHRQRIESHEADPDHGASVTDSNSAW